MVSIDKTLVTRRFSEGFRTYDREAVVQKDVARKLVSEVARLNFHVPTQVLEVGCGTGLLTEEILRYLHAEQLVVNDICTAASSRVRELEKKYNQTIRFMPGDAEEIDFPDHLSTVISGSTIQWLRDLDTFFNKIHQSLNNKGIWAFSTFGPENFREVKHLTGIGLNYPSLHELLDLLADHFHVVKCEEWLSVQRFDSPLSVFRHMKDTGVNGVQQKKMGRGELSKLAKAYSKYFSDSNKRVVLTYHPILVIAQKK